MKKFKASSSSVKAIVGMQWGDEGKGKIVDYQSADYDVAVRYQGGPNAGHTVVIDDQEHVLHHLPSSLLSDTAQGVIAQGVVIDPETLLEEILDLEEEGMSLDDRLIISPQCHVIMPYHRKLDALYEGARGDEKVDTTGRGIGPCYGDKASYWGVQMKDLLSKERLRQKLDNHYSWKSRLIRDVFGEEVVSRSELEERYLKCGQQLSRYVTDGTRFLQESVWNDDDVLLEGAQGTLLDVDHGTYPFVTASNPTAGGVFSGTGLPPSSLSGVLGVAKAYTTRVGEGPFPTELEGDIAEKLQNKGDEFGSTTGRPRRCGWLDLVALRYACRVNGIDQIALTKLDILTSFQKLHVCTEYRGESEATDQQGLFSEEHLSGVEPVYESFPGWEKDVRQCDTFSDLPQEAREYVAFIEQFLQVPVTLIGTGPARRDIIVCTNSPADLSS